MKYNEGVNPVVRRHCNGEHSRKNRFIGPALEKRGKERIQEMGEYSTDWKSWKKKIGLKKYDAEQREPDEGD